MHNLYTIFRPHSEVLYLEKVRSRVKNRQVKCLFTMAPLEMGSFLLRNQSNVWSNHHPILLGCPFRPRRPWKRYMGLPGPLNPHCDVGNWLLHEQDPFQPASPGSLDVNHGIVGIVNISYTLGTRTPVYPPLNFKDVLSFVWLVVLVLLECGAFAGITWVTKWKNKKV